MNHNDATAAGYASFNQGNHVAIDVPDGQTTYSFRTSDGKRLTVCFLPTTIQSEAAGCVDVAYHGTEAAPTKDDRNHQAFEALLFGRRDSGSLGDQFDSRRHPHPTNIVTILMEPLKAR